MTTLSLRERRYQQALKDRARLERQRDEMLDKLTRVTGNLKTVRRSIERYERTPASPPIPAPAIVEPPVQPVAGAVAAASGSFDDLEAPAFLRRKLDTVSQKHEAEQRDAIARATIEAEQANRRTAKARGRIATMKAKQSGAMKAMPLTGKAALAKIMAG